jgi:putative sigma-54 modulation protein
MHAIVHAVDVKYSERLSGMIAEKLNKLGRIAADAVRGDVYLRRENKDGKLIKVVEVKIQLPGGSLVLKKEGITFDHAVHAAFRAALRWVQKAKSRRRPH